MRGICNEIISAQGDYEHENILKCTRFLLLNRKDQDWQTAQILISFTKQSQYLMERRNEKAGMD